MIVILSDLSGQVRRAWMERYRWIRSSRTDWSHVLPQGPSISALDWEGKTAMAYIICSTPSQKDVNDDETIIGTLNVDHNDFAR